MEDDEIVYNAFYHLLRDKYRKKYELALSKCWTICVPCGDSLRGTNITNSFVDDHILKPHSELPLHFTSTDENNSFLYKMEDTTIQLLGHDKEEFLKSDEQQKINILSVERGYNKEFLMYTILILETPLHSKYKGTQKSPQDRIRLNRGITCYKDALEFLHEFSEQEKCLLDKLRLDLRELDLNEFDSAEDLSSTLQELTRRYWANTMRKHTLELQRDARFQKLLSTSLEVFIMHFLHDRIYPLLGNALEQEDLYVRKKLNQLVDRGITPDQLGATESLAISLPAAIVELATLDAREGPLEKLLCLRSTLDLIVAEIKGALADVESKSDESSRHFVMNKNHSAKPPSTDNLIPLLLYVIVKSRPRRLVTDLHYIQNFLWSISPHDGLSYTLVTFQTAVSDLYQINVQTLPPRSHKIKTELPICELLDVIAGNDKDITPIDRQIHQLAVMLEKCTQTQELYI